MGVWIMADKKGVPGKVTWLKPEQKWVFLKRRSDKQCRIVDMDSVDPNGRLVNTTDIDETKTVSHADWEKSQQPASPTVTPTQVQASEGEESSTEEAVTVPPQTFEIPPESVKDVIS
jgi:hypothetical protein